MSKVVIRSPVLIIGPFPKFAPGNSLLVSIETIIEFFSINSFAAINLAPISPTSSALEKIPLKEYSLELLFNLFNVSIIRAHPAKSSATGVTILSPKYLVSGKSNTAKLLDEILFYMK